VILVACQLPGAPTLKALTRRVEAKNLSNSQQHFKETSQQDTGIKCNMGFLPYEKEVHEAVAFIAHAESFLKFAILALVFMIMLQLLILLLAALLLAAMVSP
jgi:hypothetical protein